MGRPVLIAAVRDDLGELLGEAGRTLRLGERRDAPSDVISPPSKAAVIFLG